jgi:hypothetical protein
MKKILIKINLFFLIVLIGTNISAFSQNLKIFGLDQITESADISTDWEIQLYPTIRNISANEITVKVRIEPLEIPEGHSFGACWAGGCLAATIGKWDSQTSIKLPGNSDSPEFTFVAHYYCNYQGGNCTPGTAKFRYTFFNAENPSDNAVLNATLSFVGELGIQESLSLPEINAEYLKGNILKFTAEEAGNSYYCSIFSVNGNLLKSVIFSESTEINLNDLVSGAFVYSVQNQSGNTVAKGKFLKD